MSEISSYIKLADQALDLFDKFMTLGNRIKTILTPDYQQAAEDLAMITNIIYGDIQKILDWTRDFEDLDFSKVETKEKFSQFKRAFDTFTTSTEYYDFVGHCHDIRRIYKSSLGTSLKKLFTRDKKSLRESNKIFKKLSYADDSVQGLANAILEQQKRALRKINKNYNNAESVQKEFIDDIDKYRQKLNTQSLVLNKLRNDFYDKAGRPAYIHLYEQKSPGKQQS